MSRWIQVAWLVLATVAVPTGFITAQVLRAADMTVPEWRALDRQRTVILLPGGIIEEHGPYLPSYTDGYLNQRLTDSLAAAIAARPGWTVVVFPAIPLGNSGANDIGGKYSFPGTFAVRFETLRSVFLDLADELGAQGFRWVFIIHLHGGPNHNRALDQAGDYFHEVYGGRMVHLAGLMSIFAMIEGPKELAAKQADGLAIHSGMDETSWLLAIAPSLVRPGYRDAPSQADSTMDGLIRLARASEWPGYFGAPGLATVEHGQRIWRNLADSTIQIALRVLDGWDPKSAQRFGTVMMESPPDVRLDTASRRAEAARARRQAAWLRRHAF